MPITAKEMVKLLKKNGFEEVSQRGSHLKLRNHSTGYTVTVPMHSGDLKKGLERAICERNRAKKIAPMHINKWRCFVCEKN